MVSLIGRALLLPPLVVLLVVGWIILTIYDFIRGNR